MRKLYFIATLLITSAIFTACENGDGLFGDTDFGDYTEQNVYFPIQYPVRTLILGEDRIDNSIDNQHAFHIGAAIGGLRENKQNIQVQYRLAPELMTNLKGMDTKKNVLNTLKVMPDNYFTIENVGETVIKKGEFSGLIRVNLTDDFFNDPEAINLTYAIPLRLTATSYGNLLSGTPKAGVENPNPLLASDWEAGATPKDYTIFAVKYVNPWHGNFFQRGVQKVNGVVDQVFHTEDLEKGQISMIETAGYRTALYKRMGMYSGDAYASKLVFSESTNGEGTVVVEAPEGSSYEINGTGKYYESTTEFARQYGSWLMDPNTQEDIPHLTITLDFSVKGIEGTTDLYQFTDTLVFRDKGITYEEFVPTLGE